MHRRPSSRHILIAVIAAFALLGATPTSADARHRPPRPPTSRVVVRGLNNPRQVWRDASGKLFVAEAGNGGSVCGSSGPEGPQCLGTTGSIARIHYPGTTQDGTFERVVTGLLSSAAPDGTGAVGSDGVATRNGTISIAMTWAPPDVLPAPLPGDQAGKLLQARSFGPVRTAADITGVEFSTPNPDGYVDPTTGQPELDSNPYAVLAQRDRILVADAAGNDIIEVRPGKAPRVFAVLPSHGDPVNSDQQPTPTSLAEGPGNTILVGELGHLEPGEGRVSVLSASGRYRGYIGRGGDIADVPDGLSAVTGVAYRKGQVYVSQLGLESPAAGTLSRISWKKHPEIRSLAVPFPAGVAVDRADNVFVAAWSIAPETGLGAPDSSGQIWRVRF